MMGEGCSRRDQLIEEISDLQDQMREMQREHDYQFRELENQLRMADQEAHRHDY